MDRFVVTAWARKLVLVLFCVVALIWGIRQASMTYLMWFPDKEATKTKSKNDIPLIPESAKTIGEQFVWQFYSVQQGDTREQKQSRLMEWVTPHLQNQWVKTPSLILLSEQLEPEQVVLWDAKWMEVGKRAWMEYQMELADQRKLQLRLLVVRSGDTWLVDSLPSLSIVPSQGRETFQPNIKVSDGEKKSMEQATDGFFDSWLKGRVDANTKALNQPNSNLLKQINGEYQSVSIEPIKQNPLLINATVWIEIKSEKKSDPNQVFPFQYQLELEKTKDQYVVKKIIGEKNHRGVMKWNYSYS